MVLTRKETAQATRIKIITAAFTIVGEESFAGLTSNKLVNVAGIAKGTLYHHFKSLDDVVSAMMQKITDDFMQSTPIEQFDSMAEYLDALGDYQINILVEDKVIMNVFYGFLPKSIHEKKYQLICQKLLDGACGQIVPAIKNFYGDNISPEKIERTIRMIDIFCIGFNFHLKVFEDKQAYKILWQDFSLLLIHYLELE
jgi:AcrR family transcriptional regulator